MHRAMLCSLCSLFWLDQEPNFASVVPLPTVANWSLLLGGVTILLALLISNSKRELDSILFAEYDFYVTRYCGMHAVVLQEWLTFKLDIYNTDSEITVNCTSTSVMFMDCIFSV